MDGKTLLIVAIALAAGFHFYVSEKEAPGASPAASGIPSNDWHSDIPASWLNTRHTMQQYFTPYVNEFGLHTTTAGFEIQITAPEAAQKGDSAIWGVSVNNEALGVGEKRIYTQPFEIELSVNPWYQITAEFSDPTLEALTSEENSKFVLLQVYATYLDDSTPAPMYVEVVGGKNGIGRIKVYPAEEAARAVDIKLNLISLVPVTQP